MGIIDRLKKPEYFFRPSRLLKRLTITPGRFNRIVTPSWNLSLAVDSGEVIGRALIQMGVHDLPVSEIIWRLLEVGELAVDVGANIGYMTSIMAAKVGVRGQVMAFEPHPDLFSSLQKNIDRWRSFQLDRVTAHRVALSNRVGHGGLHVPDGYEDNHGLCWLNESAVAADIPVDVDRLDDHIKGSHRVALMKIDVEGHELQVLEGAQLLLAQQRVRDIVFEEFRQYPTEVSNYLEQFGFIVYQIGMTFWGPVLSKADTPETNRRKWVAPSMLATRDPERARQRTRPRGWQILRPRVNLQRNW
jgi:FkbM family methyltransferase